ncbi:hypothetical protein ACIGO8_29705 [Streptomyces sp. NPDC053493]|uniref:hypothetical protein n=1 Tax=Streptomyces sp. NPDC053493 TaxID=3365705 RepID=UPI0037D4C2CA
MTGSAWARFREHRWLPQATVAVLAAAVIAGFVLVRAERREWNNEDALARACGGVLPREAVRGLLPDDEWWRVRAAPGPRDLTDCGVGGEEGAALRVTAVPVLDAPLKGVRVEDLTGDPYERAPGWSEEYERADAQTVVACPAGLPGVPRPVTSFRVHGTLSGDEAGADTVDEVGLAVAAVANRLRERYGCGGAPVRPADVRPAPRPDDEAEDAAGKKGEAEACGWFRPAYLGAGWRPTGQPADGAAHAWARACWTGALKGARTVGVTSASWWGEVLPEARTAYGRELAALDAAAAPPKNGRTATLAAWAESRCAGGPALHRVSLTAKEPAGLPAQADALLRRYLDAAHGCRDTRILGKVWS